MIALSRTQNQDASQALPRLQHRAARHGELRLGFARRSHRTVMNNSFSRVPLQVMRAITDSAGCACVYILSPTGAVIQGDRYNTQITVEENAHALVTTLAATKVYRMPQGKAVQYVTIEIAPGATLEYVPDAAILFEDADFEQSLDIYLHDGALLILQESVMAGRLAAGESLRFRRYFNRITVRDAHGLLLHEVQEVIPHASDLDRIGVLEGYRCWASWYLLGDLQRFAIDSIRFCEKQEVILSEDDNILGSASRLHRNGLGIRLLAPYWSPMAGHLARLRQTVRSEHMGLPAPALRK